MKVRLPARGLKIFTRTWQPEGTPRALIVLAHGFNLHSGYYTWAGELAPPTTG